MTAELALEALTIAEVDGSAGEAAESGDTAG
jgi:hypothetical protein